MKKTKHKPVTYEKAPFPADQLKVGDILILDVGYNLQNDYQPCTVTHISLTDGLFGEPETHVRARESDGRTFCVAAWLFTGLPATNQ